jgi:hypothetical protein
MVRGTPAVTPVSARRASSLNWSGLFRKDGVCQDEHQPTLPQQMDLPPEPRHASGNRYAYGGACLYPVAVHVECGASQLPLLNGHRDRAMIAWQTIPGFGRPEVVDLFVESVMFDGALEVAIRKAR